MNKTQRHSFNNSFSKTRNISNTFFENTRTSFYSGKSAKMAQCSINRPNPHTQFQLLNNKRFYDATHSKFTKKCKKEEVDINELWQLPDNYIDFYSNKTILSAKQNLVVNLWNQQRLKSENYNTKKRNVDIQKECQAHCDIDESAKLRQLLKLKVQKLNEIAKPTIEEMNVINQAKLKDQL